MVILAFIILLLIGGAAESHQFTPTYPKFEPSYVEGIMQTKMELFNSRKDVNFYELGVYTEQWDQVPFASESKLIQTKYLETKRINVYLRTKDLREATYICTTSLLKKEDMKHTGVASKICSKIKIYEMK